MIAFALLPILVGVLFLTAVWRALSDLALARHWPWWTASVCLAATAAVLVLTAIIRSVLQEIRARRERRDLSAMEQRFPGCHVHRLHSGQWFLTDRSSGREYQPGKDAHHASRLGKTRDGSSVWLQKVANESRASASRNSSQ